MQQIDLAPGEICILVFIVSKGCPVIVWVAPYIPPVNKASWASRIAVDLFSLWVMDPDRWLSDQLQANSKSNDKIGCFFSFYKNIYTIYIIYRTPDKFKRELTIIFWKRAKRLAQGEKN